ncbi:uncharacterized protein [Asterias amurensis]|uniref:uncharacterized protein n=1 Tax=Asterias amurensis TaxID=7602 RepID=UPI003AB26FEA
MEIENNHTPETEEAANYFRRVLANALNPLLEQVEYQDRESKLDDVKQSLRNITKLYKTALNQTTPSSRSDWNDAGNRCAYVFVYFMQHCYLVHYSLQQIQADISKNWQNKSSLNVCSIGGGPGSDLVGLTRFLTDAALFPSSLTCVVLDLYPNWKHTWGSIYDQLHETFDVTYRKCDLVNTAALQDDILRFVGKAHLLTFVKSFSAVASFLRQDQRRGDRLRAILRALKGGTYVLYIDNTHWDKSFLNNFALPAGLEVVFDLCGKQTLPFGQQLPTIREFSHYLDFRPMRTCDVTIWILYKNKSVRSNVQSTEACRQGRGHCINAQALSQKFRPDPARMLPAQSVQNTGSLSQNFVQPIAAPKFLPTLDTSYKYAYPTPTVPTPATPTVHQYHRPQINEVYQPTRPCRDQTSEDASRHMINDRNSAWKLFKRCVCCCFCCTDTLSN